MVSGYSEYLLIILTCDVFMVKYKIADFKAVFYAESKNHTHFLKSDQFLFRYKLLLEM